MAASKMYDAQMSPNKVLEPGATPATSDSPKSEDYWMMVARDSYIQAESYFDANIRRNLERNISHFANRHAPGSKYYTKAYKQRHKGFRPKTRSMVRRNEAAAAIALFSTADVVHIKAARSSNKAHRVSAEINQELLQYRLDETIPWYLTAQGAYQETLVAGVVISHQYWNYDEVETKVPQFDEDNEMMLDDDDMPLYAIEYTLVKDTPAVDLRPLENVFFSVSADWRDPIGTSPFVIDKIPMTIDEIKRMAKPTSGTKVPWIELSDEQLLVGVTTDYDPVRRQREANREDSKDQRHLHRGYDTAWVHRNIVKKDGRDWIFYTLGIHFRLSDPIPLEMEYPHLKIGERPYILGISNIEAHKNYPESIAGLGGPTNQEANEINNQRRDNVALALNRRYIVKRSAMIDYAGLQRNVPGGVTETDDPNNDIKIESPKDVTSSSYKEQEMVNLDYDELTGHFSSSSVGSNRNLGETVGGLELLEGDSDSLTEYPLKTFVVTWVLPVLKQLIKLEQYHESDRALLALIGEKLKLWQKYKINEITDAWIQGNMNIEVNVGFGSTNPKMRVERLAVGLSTVVKFAPGMLARIDGEEVANEVMGALGYPGTDRFFPLDKAQSAQEPPEGQMTENDQAKLDQEFTMHAEKMEDAHQERTARMEMKFMDLELATNKLFLDEKLSQQQFEEAMAKIQTDRQNKVDEMKIKLKLGSGI